MTDQELAERLAAGDRDALVLLVRTHHPGLFRFLRQLTRSREDAEDLTQQTLLRARDAACRYDGRASMRTWLHRIAFHEFTRWRRRQKWHLDLGKVPPANEKRYDGVIEAAWLEDLLAQLPEKMRAAFLLHEVEEMPLPEVAAVLGVPVGTVKSRLFHARERLKKQLEDRREVLNATEAYES